MLSLLFLMGASKAFCEQQTLLLSSNKPIATKGQIKSPESSLSGVFFETYGGIFWGLIDVSHLATKNTYGISQLKASFHDTSATRSSSVTGIGGVKLGAWLEKSQYHGHPSPNWLKYFGLYVDLDYQYLKYEHALKNAKIRYLDFSGSPNLGPAYATTSVRFKTNGPSVLAAFMLAGRLGFYPTKSVPFGWFQPYLAIGPGAFFIKQKSKLVVSPHETNQQNQFYLNLANASTMDTGHFDQGVFPALAIDFGFYFRPFEHLSFDSFIKYCYVVPHFSFDSYQWVQKESCHLFSTQLGIALHY